jgi:copper(I)-binding protein
MPGHSRTVFATALLLATIAADPADAHETKFGHLTIVHPWCRTAPNGVFGFMKITNNGTEDDRLLKVTAEISDNVQLSDGQVISPAGGIPIPAGQTVKFTPGSFHIVFLKAKSELVPSTEIKGSLIFEKAGTLQVEFEVDEPTD